MIVRVSCGSKNNGILASNDGFVRDAAVIVRKNNDPGYDLSVSS